MFKLQACTILELNKVALTIKLCSWKKSRQRAHPAPMTQISFKRPKKTDLFSDLITNVPHQLPSFSVRGDEIENDIETKEKLLELKLNLITLITTVKQQNHLMKENIAFQSL